MALAKIKGQAARHEKQVIELLGKARRQKLMKLLKEAGSRDANQMRFMEDAFDGLLCDKTRRSRIQVARRRGGRGVAQTLADPPVEATHWTSA
jgi:hypothetical protein